MKASIADILLSLLIPTLILLHLFISPYTKVEESFNIQATHDILAYGVPTEDIGQRLKAEYDHHTFSGAVPRTFVGALLLAGVSRPVIGWCTGPQAQSLVRGVLGLFNACALLLYARRVYRAFGRNTGRWYLLLQASQFHVIYYASRTLPNMFAFGLTTIALSNFLPVPSSRAALIKRYRLSVYLITLTGVIFRSELALLLFPILVMLAVAQSHLSLSWAIITAGLLGATVGLLTTISIDSFFWQKWPLWPELQSLFFNVVDGKSSEWGTSPWHYYFTSALPRLLLNPLSPFLLSLSLFLPSTRRPAFFILIPHLAFITLYSIQPHKEWRFIIYSVPPFTTVLALSFAHIYNRRTKSLLYLILSLMLIASILASFVASTAMALISSLNYPGGQALARLHALADGEKKVLTVHMDVASCMSGVTRFQERHPPPTLLGNNATLWVYDKTEDEAKLNETSFWNRFDYVLAEDPTMVKGSWKVVDIVGAFAGVRVLRPEEDGGLVEPFLEGRGKWKQLGLEMEKSFRQSVGGWWVGIEINPRTKILRHETVEKAGGVKRPGQEA